MDGIAEPKLIVDGVGSPHTYAMKPSNAADLARADLVFWAGDHLEAFLVKPLETLGDKATVVELLDTPGLVKLKFREGGPFEAHTHDDEEEHEIGHGDHDAEETAAAHHDHAHADDDHDDHGGFDMHFWLDPLNAKALSAEIKTAPRVDRSRPCFRLRGECGQARRAAGCADREDASRSRADQGQALRRFHDAYQYSRIASVCGLRAPSP